MASVAELTAYGMYKILWTDKAILEFAYKDIPEFSLLPRDTNFSDVERRIPAGICGGQGISPVFTTAKSNKSPSRAIEWAVSTTPLYALGSISGDLIRRSKGKKAILVDPIKREGENLVTHWKLQRQKEFYGNGGGALARSTSATVTSSQTFTVATADDLRFIWKGMVLQSASTDGTSGSVKPGTVTVNTVNRQAGTFTISEGSIVTGIPTFANTDYLFREGTFGVAIKGLDAWLPASAPSATLFNGVDRTQDLSALSGLILDVSSKSPRAKAKDLAREVVKNGGSPNVYLLNIDDWADLEADLDSAGKMINMKAPATKVGGFQFGVEYDAIGFMGPKGAIRVVPSAACPQGVGYMLDTSVWTFGSMGEIIRDITTNPVEDGADAMEIRMLGDNVLYCSMPGYNCRGVL